MGSRTVVALLLLCACTGMVACDSGEQSSEERAPAEGRDRTVTRTVLVTEAAPLETTMQMETTGTVAAEPPSPCGAPEETLVLQYQRINSGDFAGAYELFAERSKQVISLEQYTAFFEANAPYSLTDYSFPSVVVRGEAATVRAAFTVNSPAGQEFLERIQELACEDGIWRAVMREEQAAAFAEAASERQDETPEPLEEPAPEPQYEAPEPEPTPAPEPQYEEPTSSVQEPQDEPNPETQYEPPPETAAPTPPGGDVDCSDFSSSAEAQPYLLPGDPNNLDAGGDGQACDSLD